MKAHDSNKMLLHLINKANKKANFSIIKSNFK